LIKGKEYVGFDALEEGGMSRDAILWAIENLSKNGLISVRRVDKVEAELSPEGESYVNEFPEEVLVKALVAGKESSTVSKIENKIGLMWAKKNGWIEINSDKAIVTGTGKIIADGNEKYAMRDALVNLKTLRGGKLLAFVNANKEVAGALTKRNLVKIEKKSVVESVSITDTGAKLLAEQKPEKGIGPLTREALAKRTWEQIGFRKYDVNAPAERLYPARSHLLREFINLIRHKWLEMGFVETSGPIVESAFWNFDALFSPQDHPTREMQDTFFLSNPKGLAIDDIELKNRVKKMHVKGFGEKWGEEIAKSAILRTHTTNISARYMNKLASVVDANYPLKLFSVGSVFRNESVDYKHLAELHQYDGIIIGDNLTFANLIDTLTRFYAKLGLEDIRFRPSYFPFTEPSLEAFYYDEEHGGSIELTGGGIIRKEITKAMGIDKTVLAWGGGVDRLLLNRKIFGMDSILSLYKNNVGWLRSRKGLGQ